MILAAAAALAFAASPPEHLLFDGILMGVRRDGSWRSVGRSNGALASHEFQQIGIGASGGPDVRVEGLKYAPEAYGVFATNEASNGVIFNGKATYPRPVQVLPFKNQIYTDILRKFLRKRGIRSEPSVDQVISADLDGDGTREILMTASFLPNGDDPSKKGDWYSLALIRYVSHGKAVDKELELSRTHINDFTQMLKYSVLAVADFDGDGVLEFVLERRLIVHLKFGSLIRYKRGKVEVLADGGYTTN